MIEYLNDVSQVWWQWMGSMFWQVNLLIIIVTALDMIIRKWAWPQVRYALWALVFIKLVISPTWQSPASIVTLVQPQLEEKVSVQIGKSNEAVNSTNTLLTQDNVKEEVVEAVTWKTWLFAGWISGMIVFSILLLKKLMQFRQWRQIQMKLNISERHNEVMLKIAGKLKLKKIPTVIFSKDFKSPAVYGVLNQFLIIPEGYMERLSKEQAEHVLIHEFCHFKRRDLLVHWFCIVLQIIYWFNPLLIWSRRQMRHICEICCDLSVANILREKTVAYRETLLHSARELFAENIEPGLGFLGIFEEPYRLVPRLKWLEKRSWERRGRRIAVTICATLFMVTCVMPMAGNSQTVNNNGNLPVKPVFGETDLKQDMVYYELLIMELGINKEFKFSSSSIQVIPEMIFAFNEGLEINGKALKDIGELFRFMLADSDVNILSRPQVMTANGERAEFSITDKSDKEVIQNISITPNIINANDYITQNIKIEIIRKNEDDSALVSKKVIENTLMIKDGKTVLIKIMPDDIDTVSEEDQKPVYIFITPRIIRKPHSDGEEAVTQNSSNDPRKISIDFDNVDINILIKFISKFTGKNFIVDEDVKGKVNIKTPTKLSVEETYKLFESVLEINGYTTIPTETAIKIVKTDKDI
jgi:beta-lactamase regulating signal transducer with metallopeptidase domain